MILRCFFGALLIASVFSDQPCFAQQNDESQQVIALENAWNQSEAKADISGLDLMLADGFVYTDVDGSVKNRAQWLSDVKKESLHYEQLANRDQVVHMYGNTALVTGEYREKVVLKGKTVLRRGRFTDTWIKLNGVWKCVASQATLIAG